MVGLDISERMIALARAQEKQQPLGIDYVVADARSTVAQQDYDVVVSAWLLVYAQNRAELAQMCRGLACRVKPGGRFVTVNTNPGCIRFGPTTVSMDSSCNWPITSATARRSTSRSISPIPDCKSGTTTYRSRPMPARSGTPVSTTSPSTFPIWSLPRSG